MRDFVTIYLKVHVPISANQKASVLESPFEADVYWLARQLLHEWLGVHWVNLCAIYVSNLSGPR